MQMRKCEKDLGFPSLIFFFYYEIIYYVSSMSMLPYHMHACKMPRIHANISRNEMLKCMPHP